jgi:hypothetical protein
MIMKLKTKRQLVAVAATLLTINFSVAEAARVGPKGLQGAPGARGASGAAGAPGVKGDAGAAGVKGDAGPVGAAGVKGDAGPVGAAGVIGPAGAPGVKGDAGAAGVKGDAGPVGAAGVIGPAGAAGVKGDAGAVGAVGAAGVKGDAGAAGASGAVGTQGAVGAAGVKGDAGAVGAAGAAGAKGDAGPAGAAGASGAVGAPGARGVAGTNGSSFIYSRTCGVGGTDACKIGSVGPGGGWIFFVDYNEQYSGFNYLEAAPTDISAVNWCSDTVTSIGAVADWSANAVGAGQANTRAMTVAGACTSGAANSRQAGVSSFANGYYWSSTESSSDDAWGQGFDSGVQDYGGKNYTLPIRAVRAF